jgi:hypothetical protein
MSAEGAVILADLAKHAVCFDLTLDGLGERLAEALAVGVFAYMDAETDPDNNAWIPLSERYERWKSAHFPGLPMSHLYGLMKQPDQLKGTLNIKPDGMTQTYGTDEDAQNEAVWFQEGNDRQPARRFYDFNEQAEHLIADVLDDRFDQYIGK